MAQLPGDARVNQYTATAGQTTFTYDFKIKADGEIIVQKGSTTLTLTTHYTVTDAGEEAGGTIVLVTGAALNDIITLTGNSMVERETTFSNGGDFAASAINGEYNNILSMLSETVTDIDQAVRLAVYDPAFNSTIPTPVARKALMINTAGTGFEMSTNDPDAQATAAAASAAAALVSENNASDSEDAAAISETNAEQSAIDAAASAASVDFSAVASDIVPDENNTRDVGSAAKYFKTVRAYSGIFLSGVSAAGGLSTTTNLVVNANKFTVLGTNGNTQTAGTLSSDGNFDVATNKFTVDATTGNTVVAGTLTVGGSLVGAKAAAYDYHVAYDVHGGSYSSANTWQTRPLNTEVFDTIGASLASNQITLPAGTYTVWASGASINCGFVKHRVYNVTNSAVLGVGTEHTGSGAIHSVVGAAFTLAAPAAIEIQMIGTATQANSGMGNRSAVEAYGDSYYANVLITKIA